MSRDSKKVMPAEREVRQLLRWALDILAPLIKALPQEGGGVFDPGGIIKNHRAFAERGWVARRRCGFDSDVESIICSVLTSGGELTPEIKKR